MKQGCRPCHRLALLLPLLLLAAARPCMPSLLQAMLYKANSSDMQQYMQECRHHLHTHPELRFQEQDTSAYLQQKLTDMSIAFQAPVAGTGIVAVVGESGPSWPSIALRADMDALPVHQAPDQPPPRSAVPGVKHACGHDAHMCMLLGAARLLKGQEPELRGRVVLLFQPGEEGGGGAKRMLEQGALQGVQAVAGLHVWPQLPAGTIGVRAGTIMAASDRFTFVVAGRGGHAALPHLARDPVVAASAVVLALQTLVSRETSPLAGAVVTVSRFNTGEGAQNVIPDAVTLQGTIRALDNDLFNKLRRRVEEVVNVTAQAYGCSVQQATWSEVAYPPTVNDPDMASLVGQLVEDAVRKQQGSGAAVALQWLDEPSMAAEDFSFYGAQVPSVFSFLGIGDADRGTDMPLHHPAFRMDDEQLPLGAALHAATAIEYLHQHAAAQRAAAAATQEHQEL